jgi:hypothetical protein
MESQGWRARPAARTNCALRSHSFQGSLRQGQNARGASSLRCAWPLSRLRVGVSTTPLSTVARERARGVMSFEHEDLRTGCPLNRPGGRSSVRGGARWPLACGSARAKGGHCSDRWNGKNRFSVKPIQRNFTLARLATKSLHWPKCHWTVDTLATRDCKLLGGCAMLVTQRPIAWHTVISQIRHNVSYRG